MRNKQSSDKYFTINALRRYAAQGIRSVRHTQKQLRFSTSRKRWESIRQSCCAHPFFPMHFSTRRNTRNNPQRRAFKNYRILSLLYGQRRYAALPVYLRKKTPNSSISPNALRRCAARGIDIKIRFPPSDVLRRIAAQSICIKSRFPRDDAHCGSGVRRAIPAPKNSAADSFAVDRVPFPQIYALIPFRIRLSGGGKHP